MLRYHPFLNIEMRNNILQNDKRISTTSHRDLKHP